MQALLSSLNNLFALSFQDTAVEEEYQSFFSKEHKEQNVFAAKIAIALYILYALLTYAIIQNEAILLLQIVLFAISGPIFLLSVSRKSFFDRYRQETLFFAALITGLGPALFYTFTTNDRALFQVDQVIPIIAIFTMYGVGFSLALLIYLSITFVFFSVATLVGVTDNYMFMAFYISIVAAIVSAISGYMIEKSTRKLFLAKMKSDEFKFIVENSHDAISIFEVKTLKYLHANKQALIYNNETAETILGKNIFDVHKNLSPDFINLILKDIEEKGVFNNIFSLVDANEKTYYVHNITQYGFFDSKKVIISVSSDVTKLKETELQMQEMAFKDSLTRLFNRYKLNEYSQLEIDRYQREKHNVSLMICDIDLFKRVNDTHGHLAGDGVLQKIASTLKESVRSTDIVARWGGEEFALVLGNTPKEEALEVAKKVNEKIAAIDFKEIGQVTISCGVSQLEDADTQTTWFKRVDDALYEAKENGRDRVVYK